MLRVNPASERGLIFSILRSDLVFGLRARWNERGEFLVTTTTPTNEAETEKDAIVFPHIVDGGGYTTQFVQYSGTSAEPGLRQSSALRAERKHADSVFPVTPVSMSVCRSHPN